MDLALSKAMLTSQSREVDSAACSGLVPGYRQGVAIRHQSEIVGLTRPRPEANAPSLPLRDPQPYPSPQVNELHSPIP